MDSLVASSIVTPPTRHPRTTGLPDLLRVMKPYLWAAINQQHLGVGGSDAVANTLLSSSAYSPAGALPIVSSVLAASIVASGRRVIGAAVQRPRDGAGKSITDCVVESLSATNTALNGAPPISYYAAPAAVESFYRSAMNHLINEKVRGVKSLSETNLSPSAMFPKMYLQVPTRVMYITGIKQVRATLDAIDASMTNARSSPAGTLSPHQAAHGIGGIGGASMATAPISLNEAQNVFMTSYLRAGLFAILPGILMCPLSSLLEASNVNPKSNNAPLLTHRWRYGFAPRLAREVLFAIGINQAADRLTGLYAHTAVPGEAGALPAAPTALQSAAGSLTAGLLAGYLSHTPHVLSALRLMNPNATYASLWKSMYSGRMASLAAMVQSASSAPTSAVIGKTPILRSMFSVFVAPALKNDQSLRRAAMILTVLTPVGVVRRSCQIAGTFTIINGLMYFQLRTK